LKLLAITKASDEGLVMSKERCPCLGCLVGVMGDDGKDRRPVGYFLQRRPLVMSAVVALSTPGGSFLAAAGVGTPRG
jgi:hypothetical protein